MTNGEEGGESSSPSTEKPGEEQQPLGLTTEEGEVIPAAEPAKAKGKVAMINGRKVGCVFPRLDMRVEPGETYHVPEKLAKEMEKIKGQRRV